MCLRSPDERMSTRIRWFAGLVEVCTTTPRCPKKVPKALEQKHLGSRLRAFRTSGHVLTIEHDDFTLHALQLVQQHLRGMLEALRLYSTS